MTTLEEIPAKKAPTAEEMPIESDQKTNPRSRGSLVFVRTRQIDKEPNTPRESRGLFWIRASSTVDNPGR